MDRPAVRLLERRPECEFLDAVLADARDGRSRVVVLRGKAGAGESVLLEFAGARAEGWSVATAVGIESETELPYSGFASAYAPVLDPNRPAAAARLGAGSCIADVTRRNVCVVRDTAAFAA